jgi:uncharacterized membrane protein (UPF0127 family)
MMNSRWISYGVAVVAVLAAVALLALSTGAVAPLLGSGYEPGESDTADPGSENDTTAVHSAYEHATVTVSDASTGEELGRIEAAVADTWSKRYLGLSETDELPENRGMLFVYDEPGEHTYVMRNMSFGIDIVFIDADGTITTIHEAPKPGPDENGNDQTYPGEGQYVLEVNKGWMADRGVEVGDRVDFEL